MNSIGSFTCTCPPGQARNPETNRCDDRDECEDEGVCENGRCINTPGSYICLCNPGFIQSQDKQFCIGMKAISVPLEQKNDVSLVTRWTTRSMLHQQNLQRLLFQPFARTSFQERLLLWC